MAEMALDITLGDKDGLTVPVTVTLTYPDDMGLHAITALKAAAENSGEITARLLHQGDGSVIAALLKMEPNDV